MDTWRTYLENSLILQLDLTITAPSEHSLSGLIHTDNDDSKSVKFSLRGA